VIGLEPNQGPYRILVVDDTKANRLLLIKLLEPIGFKVREAANGLEAVALWESWRPHLILIDTRMPVMGGVEATRQIRAREREMGRTGEFPIPDTRFPTPVIIVITASVFEQKRGEILAAGSNDFVRKPFSEEIIFQKINQHLGVLYLYEELPQVVTASLQFNSISRTDSFLSKQLATMPIHWVADLYQAANNLREESVFDLIEQIPETTEALAIALTDLANDFRLDEIVRLTKTVMNSSKIS
jgi:CheY-like chemotaxis protein